MVKGADFTNLLPFLVLIWALKTAILHIFL